MATLNGNGQANTLAGTTADDSISGFGGSDWLFGGGGVDTIFGGLGNDVITLSGTSPQLGFWGSFAYGGDGDDILVSSQISEWGAHLNSGFGNNTVIGSVDLWNSMEGDDLIHGDLIGVGGLTVVQGVNGSGTAVSGDGRVRDTFLYIQWFELTAENDTITFSDEIRWKGCAPGEGSDTIFGGAGMDDLNYAVQTGSGMMLNVVAGTLIDPWGDTDHFTDVESFRGSEDSDSLDGSGSAFALVLNGMGGRDTVRGGNGNDTLSGGDGNDSLFGAGGDNYLYGGDGNDVIDDGPGNDTIDGGDGFDTLVRAFPAVNRFDIVLGYDLERGFNYVPESPNDGIEPLLNLEAIVFSGDLTFILTGNAVANLLQSANGNDTLIGGGGADTLIGNGGKDVITGGAGNDSLIGGTGADTFRFETLGDVDKITGFVHGVDHIALSRGAMVGLGAGANLAFGAFHAAAGAVAGHDGSDRVIYNKSTGALYFDADGNGAGDSVQFAQLGTVANHPMNLAASDFLIF